MLSRFESKYIPVPESGCWLWDAGCNKAGYGTFGIGKSCRLSHRVSYELYVGEIPDGMCVCHKCDVPSCVNPAHLFLGTHHENMRDKVNKQRAAGAHKSTAHHNGVLSDRDVMFIRERYAAGGITQQELADRYGVSNQHVSAIISGKERSLDYLRERYA